MTKRSLLILKNDPITTVGPVPSRTPDVTVVYATPAGEVAVFDPGQRDRWTKRVFSRYRRRYEVDMGDHRRTVQLRSSPLPARGDIYHFDTLIDIGFRVVDPGKIVRRNVRHVEDGLMVVCNYLIDIYRPITRQFDIQNAAGAEEAINARLRYGDTLDEGIHLYRCKARLSSDTYAHHKVAVEDANRQIELDLIKQSGKLQAQDRERQALAGRPLDVWELIRIHLEREPHDTRMALQLLDEMERARWDRQEVQDKRARKLFEFLANRNLIHAVDLGQFRDRVMTQLQSPSQPLPAAGGPSQPPHVVKGWDDPLPIPGAASAPPVPPDVVPFYVVIDKSAAVQECIAELNAGVNSLYDALIAEPDVAGLIRLSIVGYADDVDVPLALAVVRDGTERVPLSAHGQSHYAAAFERLLDCIPRDIEQLKAQQPKVGRPQVLFLSGAQPADDSRWRLAYQRLVDRDQHRYAPDIVACGVGEARAETIVRIATRQEAAFIAVDGQLARSIERYFSFVARYIVNYGQSVLDGKPDPFVRTPDGFRLAIGRF